MAENEAGRVSLGIYLDTESLAKQAPKLEKAAEKAGREAGRKLGERAGSEAGKGIEKREPAIRRSFAKAGQRAGDSFTQNVRSGMMRGQSSLMSAAGGIATKLAALFAVKKLFDFGKESISLGSDLAEVQNVVDSTFGAGSKAQKAVESFAQNAATQFGLSETMAKRYAGTFGAMGKAFGFGSDQAAEMSIKLAGLSGDIASFYNITQDEAYTKLKSVFTGETESLKELGVVMTQAALDQYALENGFGRTTAAMNEQEKVALRYQFVMSKLETASGDFSRTAGGWANQMRILRLQFDSLRASIGQGLITALTPALQALNTFMGGLVKAANTFKSFVYSLFGKQSQDMAAGAGVATNALENIGSSAGDAANSLGNVGDAATGAGKDAQAAANAIKRSLASFDKITKLTDSSSSGSGDSGGGSGGSGGGAGGGVDTSSMLQGTEWDLSGAESPLGDALAEMFRNAWEKADFTEIGAMLGAKLKGALDSIPWDGIKTSAAKISKSIATFLNGFLETEGLGASIGNTIAEAFNTGFIFVNTFLKEFHFDSLGSFISSGIQSAFRTFDWSNVTEFVSRCIKGIFDFGSGLLDGIDWEALPGDIVEAMKEAVSGIKFDEVTESLSRFFWTSWKSAFNLAKGINDLFIGFGDSVRQYFQDHISEAEAAGGTVWDGIANGIAKAVTGIGTWIKENLFDPFVRGFGEAFGIDFTTSANEILSTAFEGVYLYISDVIGGNIKQKFIDLGNGAIEGLNSMIEAITKPLSNTAGGRWLAQQLGLDSLEEIKIPLIADLDPPPGEKYKEYKNKLEGDSKKSPIQSNSEVNATKFTDKLTMKEKQLDSMANFTGRTDSLGKDNKTFATTAKFTGRTDGLNKKNKTFATTANFTGRADSLNKEKKTFNSTANFKWRDNSLSDNQRTFNSTAKFKWQNDSLSEKQKTFDAKAKFNDYKNDLGTIEIPARVRISGHTMAQGGVLRGGHWSPIQSYAAGGNPPGGQIFRARENGNPELVGTLKGSTAVMNNDQIVASVSHGVAQALAGMRFYSQDRATPHLALVMDYVRSDTAALVELAREASEAAREGSTAEILAVLRNILLLLQNLDLDVKLDGKSVKDRIVQLINQNTRATGRCEIVV